MANILTNIFSKNRVIGIIGDTNTAKSSLALTQLINLKKEKPNLNIYVYGVSPYLNKVLTEQGLNIVFNAEDLLNLKNSVLFIDEVNQLFSSRTRDKQLTRMQRFFNRIYHLNNYVILTTAESGWYNKFTNSIISAWLIKSVSFDNLVNGTRIKETVKNLSRFSETCLELSINQFFAVYDNMTKLLNFDYVSELDFKKTLPKLF